MLIAISDRLAKEISPEGAATLWNATRILMGLRHSQEKVVSIIEGVSAMLFGIRGIEESSVYQGILKRGEAQGIEKGIEKGIAQGPDRGGKADVAPPWPQEAGAGQREHRGGNQCAGRP